MVCKIATKKTNIICAIHCVASHYTYNYNVTIMKLQQKCYVLLRLRDDDLATNVSGCWWFEPS